MSIIKNTPTFRQIFKHEGTYNVTLTVTNSAGLTSKPAWQLITIYLYDVAVINVTTSPTTVTKPNPVYINVTVKSVGYGKGYIGSGWIALSSTFQVTAYYNGTPVANPQTVTNLTAGANTTLTFTLYTNVPATVNGTPYQISAYASLLPWEANTTNNWFTDGIVTVYKLPGLPSANFTYSPKNPIEGEQVTFDASGSTPNSETNAPIQSYAWDFGDNTTEIYVGANLTTTATHSYAHGGSYTARLTVTDSIGKSDAVEAVVTVYKHDVAVVKVDVGATWVLIGDTVPITVTVRNEGDFNETFNVNIYANSTQIYTKQVTLATQNSTKVGFAWNTTGVAIGNATIKAEIPPLLGETDIKDNTLIDGNVLISKRFVRIAITVSPSTIKLGENTTISGYIAPERANADVTIAYRKNGTQTWNTIKTVTTNSTGYYSYTWTPTTYGTLELNSSWPGDANTLKAENVTTLLVKSPPIASFTYTPLAPKVGDPVTFTSNSTDPDGSIVSWEWDFNSDGVIDATTESATYIYTAARTYTVTLTVTDNDGLTHTKSITITIHEKSTGISIYLIAAIGAIIIIAIGIAAYRLIRKKP